MPQGRWTQYLDFDDRGRLIIKDRTLREELTSRIRQHGCLAVDMNEVCSMDGFCPGVPVPPPPNGMCLCVVQDIANMLRSRPAEDAG